MQQAQQRTLLEAIPKDLSRPWEDPMPEEGERHLAAVSSGQQRGRSPAASCGLLGVSLAGAVCCVHTGCMWHVGSRVRPSRQPTAVLCRLAAALHMRHSLAVILTAAVMCCVVLRCAHRSCVGWG